MSTPAEALLVEDYRYRAESLWRNEQGGETRVNLFIGMVALVAAVVGSIGGSVRTLQGDISAEATVAILLALLVLGLTTMLRMMTRNRNTDEAKHQMDMVRQAFKDHLDTEGTLQHYDLFKPQGGGGRLKLRSFGGLCHTMAALNSLLLAGVAAMLVWTSQGSWGDLGAAERIPAAGAYLVILGAFCGSLYAQVHYIDTKEKEAKEKLREDEPSHAGGVVFRRNGKTVRYLVVRPSSGEDRWVLPKGHIRPDEGHIEAAIREVREETGVFARPICLVDRTQFNVAGATVDAKYYLMECVTEETSQEERRLHWLPIGGALRALTHAEARFLLLEAERRRLSREK